MDFQWIEKRANMLTDCYEIYFQSPYPHEFVTGFGTDLTLNKELTNA